jgi:orotate phosphoribosyltransferase
MKICFRSVSELNRDIQSWLPRLPRDISLVVGVPRSGLLAANLLALHLNLPLTDVDGLIEQRVFAGGRRLKGGSFPRESLVLVLDDSLDSGSQLRAVRNRIEESDWNNDIRFGAVYVTPGQERQVDFFCRTLSQPRIFEWNVMHHSILLACCLDIDGVLCCDPTQEENDDGVRYADFLLRASPLFVPTVPVGWLVTSRLEKYRAQTETWLAKNGIKFRELVMLDLPDGRTRKRRGIHAEFKAEVYLRTGAHLFIESSREQALRITELTGKDVLCTDVWEMVRGDGSQLIAAFPAETAAVSRPAPMCGEDFGSRLQRAIEKILRTVPKNADLVLVDDQQWGLGSCFAERRIRPFIERDGQYWGSPATDNVAIDELDAVIRSGATYFVLGWPAFWWLDHYKSFARHLKDRAIAVVNSNDVIIFQLSK